MGQAAIISNGKLELPRELRADLGSPRRLRVVRTGEAFYIATLDGWTGATQRARAVAKYLVGRADSPRLNIAVKNGAGYRTTDLPDGEYGIARFPPWYWLIPSRDNLAEWWEAQHDYPEHRTTQDSHANRLTVWLTEVLQPLGESFLEVGCGAGRNLAALHGERFGVDVNPEAVELASRVAEVRQGAVPDVLEEYKPGSVDVVFTSGVLTHLPDPAATIAHMRRIARRCVVLTEMHGEPRSYDFWRYPRDYRAYLDGDYTIYTDWRADGTPGFPTALLISRRS